MIRNFTTTLHLLSTRTPQLVTPHQEPQEVPGGLPHRPHLRPRPEMFVSHVFVPAAQAIGQDMKRTKKPSPVLLHLLQQRLELVPEPTGSSSSLTLAQRVRKGGHCFYKWGISLRMAPALMMRLSSLDNTTAREFQMPPRISMVPSPPSNILKPKFRRIASY